MPEEPTGKHAGRDGRQDVKRARETAGSIARQGVNGAKRGASGV